MPHSPGESSNGGTPEPTGIADLVGIRKSYSCIPCRNRKVKCDKQVPCGACQRRKEQCIWTINSQPMLSARAAATKSPTTPSFSLATAKPPDPPKDVAAGEVWDHSILSNQERTFVGFGNGKGKEKALLDVAGSGGERDVIQALLRKLPDQSYCDNLLRIYLTRVEWIHHPLHVPSFLATYNLFWQTPSFLRPTTISARQLALLFIVLCLGMHFRDVPLSMTLDQGGGVVTEESLHAACKAAQDADNYMQNHSLEGIQTCICLGLYLNDRDMSSTGDVVLAIAIKIAISLGLSRIPMENALRSDGTMEREMGRRLWWTLVCQDAYTASACGFTTLVNLNHASTGTYANINDEDLVEGRAIVAKDKDTITMSTYHLLQIGFAMTVRKFIDSINASFPNPSYKSILELDRQFRETYNALPLALRPDLPQPFTATPLIEHTVYQRVFMGITLHNRIIRLHRAFMLKGYTNERYKYSTVACLESARTLLELVANSQTGLARWWVVLVHIWTSGLVFSVDLYQCEEEEGHELVTEKRAGIELAMNLLKPATQSSTVAQRAVKVLDQMIVQDKVIRMKKKRKRKRSEVSQAPEMTPHKEFMMLPTPVPQIIPKAEPIQEQPPQQHPQQLEPAPQNLSPNMADYAQFAPTLDIGEGSSAVMSPTTDMWNSLLDTDLANIGQFDFGSYEMFDELNEGFDRQNYW